MGGFTDVFSKIKSTITSVTAGNSAVGLSIGTSSVKIVEVKKTAKGWALEHFGAVQLPEDAVINREIVNQIAVSDGIKALIDQIKLKNKNVCTSISGTALIIKRMTVEVPAGTKNKDLQDIIFWEAEQYLPFDVAEVYMDFFVLPGGGETSRDVMFVAVKKSVLEVYLQAIQSVGLSAKIVDCDFFALQHLLDVFGPNSETQTLVDVGANAMKLIVISNGVPIFTKDIGIGGANLTQEIQKQLSLSYADAESLKVGEAGDIPQEVVELMSAAAEAQVLEIKRALEFYNASSAGATITKILLTGGGAKLPNFSQLVEDRIGVAAQMLNPFDSIAYDPKVFTPEYINSIAAIAAVPIGLAVRAGEK